MSSILDAVTKDASRAGRIPPAVGGTPPSPGTPGPNRLRAALLVVVLGVAVGAVAARLVGGGSGEATAPDDLLTDKVTARASTPAAGESAEPATAPGHQAAKAAKNLKGGGKKDESLPDKGGTRHKAETPARGAIPAPHATGNSLQAPAVPAVAQAPAAGPAPAAPLAQPLPAGTAAAPLAAPPEPRAPIAVAPKPAPAAPVAAPAPPPAVVAGSAPPPTAVVPDAGAPVDIPVDAATAETAAADNATAPVDTVVEERPAGAPDVSILFVSWSKTPAERMVSMRVGAGSLSVVHEGEYVEGLQVAQIHPEAVDFRWTGQRFRVPIRPF